MAFWPRSSADHQIIDRNSKTALSSTSKLGNLLFLSIRHILVEFQQNRFTRGVAAVVFEMRRLELNWTYEIFVLLEKNGNAEGSIILCQKRCFQA